ncbi:MAG: ATP-binding protein [Lachnospiraceae bacterium]|jgi:ATP-dependent DNA helicase RecG|nr:ATP-binding protein [Lachnospiraceae bacterium]
MFENNRLEFKEDTSKTFLKTVSAFSNYDGGKIIFGVRDDGSIKPVSDPEKMKLDIENKINDSISPQPDYSLKITDSGQTVTLTVMPGNKKPYMYKSKAYRRNDTSTIEVDQYELTRLILNGQNIRFEEIQAQRQDLHFNELESALKKNLGIKALNEDILKSLGLLSPNHGFNNAAEILADENGMPGISSVKFENGVNIIRNRVTSEHKSVIAEIKEIINMFETFYFYEEIDGLVRQRREMIPKDAFREALINALIHRDWNLPAEITVFMFDDRIEITSPGGLAPGMRKEEFLRGGISMPRNRILAEIFLRIGFIEKLGTGILRIKEMYSDDLVKPSFEVLENSIKVILPVKVKEPLTNDEMKVYSVMSKGNSMSSAEITGKVPFGRSKVTGILKELAAKNIVIIEGAGRETRYHL